MFHVERAHKDRARFVVDYRAMNFAINEVPGLAAAVIVVLVIVKSF